MTTDAINIAALVDGPAEAVPDRPALILADGSICTYGELQGAVRAWAARLAEAGVGPGDRVALADWGGVRSTAVTLAVAHLGAATAQMNPRLTAPELAQLVAAAGCGSVAVGDADTLRPKLGAETTVAVVSAPDFEGAAPARAPGDDTAAIVLFTSGTTGVPKAVPLTHRALLDRVAAYRGPFDPERRPNVSIMCVPSFHVGGMLGLLVSLAGGDTTVIQPTFDAGGWLALVERHRPVSAFLVPTMLARILDHPDVGTTDTSSLRMISYGAAQAPVDLVARAMDRWPDAGFANTFGQTETIGAYTSLSPADHHDRRRMGSVGRPLPGVELRLVDPESGAEVGVGEIGEILVRSAQVAPAAGTTPVDGWLASGDLGRLDDDGYLYPLGRMADTINRGGEKFEPSEVADAVRTHPAVADVAVAGIPDAELGHRVGVALVLTADRPAPTREELRAWTADRLAPFKQPDVVVVVDALPINDLGKLPKAVVVDLIVSAVPS